DVAVLAARMLQHSRHDAERRDGIHPRDLGGRRAGRMARCNGLASERNGRDQERERDRIPCCIRRRDIPCSVHGSASLPPPASRTGSLRRRLPLAAKIALATAGATGGTPGSPTPPIFSVLSTIATSMRGISCMRSSG